MSRRGRRAAWIGPGSFGLVALAFCLYTRIDPGHTALFTALGICLGYLFTLFPLLTFSGRAMLAPGRPANGNEAFRTTAFALLARRIHRHSPAARALEHAVAVAVRTAGDAASVGRATEVVQRELAAGHDLTARQATAAAHEIRAFLTAATHTSTVPSKGTP
ncbi:hypothetical protein [Arthrobacter sp.]|uniref:hypothetical protein n=1 Tax=Arthrobacter sp. TaxID=1667 RepID=UPI003A93FFB8